MADPRLNWVEIDGEALRWNLREFRRRTGDGTWEVVVDGGRTPAGRDAVAWAQEGTARGAGEILLTSMDKDGTQDGFDLDLLRATSGEFGDPVEDRPRVFSQFRATRIEQ